jgi:hypothetical protein
LGRIAQLVEYLGDIERVTSSNLVAPTRGIQKKSICTKALSATQQLNVYAE